MEQWLNTSVYGLALAAVAWAAARSRVFDAAWRGRLWGAALIGVAVLTALPVLAANGATPLLGLLTEPSGGIQPASGQAVPGTAAGGWIRVPAIPFSTALLALAWAAVALWRAAALALAIARIRAARAASQPFPAALSARLPEWTAANAGRFALVVSDRVPAPSMLGFGRPMIAVPAAWRGRLSDEALDAVLLHELAHAERRDDLSDLGQQLLLAACWCQPAAWWIARRMAFEREAACDERAVRLTTPRRYTRCLVTIAEVLQGARATRRPLVASSAGRGRQLARRVEHVLAIDGRAPLARPSYAAAPVLAGIVALVAAGPALPRVFDVPETPAFDRGWTTVQASSRAAGPTASPVGEGGASPRLEVPKSAVTAPLQRDAKTPSSAAARLQQTARPAGDAFELRPEHAATPSDGADDTARLGTRQVPIGSRGWSGHLAPPDLPGEGGTAQDNVEGRTGVSAPFRAVGSAFSRAGAGTGRWFSRAGASVASAVVSR